jgi:hypothetical protein
MPEDDPLIDLGIRVTFVVDARPGANAYDEHWETNLDVRKISLEVFMARNLLLGLSQVVYFSADEQADLRAKLGGLWERDSNAPSEHLIRALAEGKPLHRLFREIGIDGNEGSSYLTFEVDEIVVGNSIRFGANAKGRRSLADKAEFWATILQALAKAIATVAGAAAGGATIGLVVFNLNVSRTNERPGLGQGPGQSAENPATPRDPTPTDVVKDPRYKEIMQNLTHRDTWKFAVAEIQWLLYKQGFDCGQTDGIPGDRTKREVGEFVRVKRVFPLSDDWSNEAFINKLVEETIRSERQGAER